ncbi:MAG: hypothetical protein GX548_01095 [Lentisphaerae bacterium]|nr:hypothetical protein [Lentisphaerota bacterium]
MKKQLVLLGCVLWMAAGSTRGEGLENPGFETGDLTGWFTFGTGWRTGTGADAHSGTYGTVNDVLTTDSDEWRGIYQNVYALPNNYYTGGVYIRAVDLDTSQSFFELMFLDSSGTPLAQHTSSAVTTDQGFTYAGVGPVLAPANTVTASVRGIVRMVAPPADSDFHIFDDFSFSNTTPAHVMLADWGFESGTLSSWNTFGQGWHIATAPDRYHGTYGVVNDVTPSDSDEWRGIYQNLPVTEGQTYSAGIYIRAVTIESSESFLEVQWFDSSGSILQTDQSAPHVGADQGYLLAHSHNMVAPAGAVTASVRGIVRMLSQPTANTDFHCFDEMYFLKPADLDISMSASTNLVGAHELVTYSIVVSNRSPHYAGSYIVHQALTTNLAFVSASDGGTHVGTNVTWALWGIPGYSAKILTLVATQPTYSTSTQEVSNLVFLSVETLVDDPISSNNEDSGEIYTVGVPMFTTLVLIALALVVVYAFHRHHRARPNAAG